MLQLVIASINNNLISLGIIPTHHCRLQRGRSSLCLHLARAGEQHSAHSTIPLSRSLQGQWIIWIHVAGESRMSDDDDDDTDDTPIQRS